MRRCQQVIYWDGRPCLYGDALAQLVGDRGVSAQLAVQFLDGAARPSSDEAHFFLKRLAAAVGGAVQKLGGMLKKTDAAVGKLGGGDEECEWVTIKGARGTTRICIGADGSIQKGPKELSGKKAHDVLDKDTADRAVLSAAEKKKRHHDMEKKATNRIREAADKVDDWQGFMASIGESVSSGAMDAVATGGAGMLTKMIGERFGVARKLSDKIRKKLVDRYGEKGATVIVLAGIAAGKGADLVLPGSGTVLSFLPGGHMLSAIPVAAAVEGVRAAGSESKKLARDIKRLTQLFRSGKKLESAAQRAQRRKKKRKTAEMSDAEDRTEHLTDADVRRLGKRFMRLLVRGFLADWKKHAKRMNGLAKKLGLKKQSGD